MNIIDKAKILLKIPDSDKDALLEVIYDICKQEFLDYTNRSEIPSTAEQVILNMMIVTYNKNGAQGLNSVSYSGVSEAYIDGYPQNILKQLNKFRKLKTI